MRFLVIDEADRMIENGHFAELENIVRLTERQPQYVPLLPHLIGVSAKVIGQRDQTRTIQCSRTLPMSFPIMKHGKICRHSYSPLPCPRTSRTT
jgi:superfamily II DNA/RNA helicase